MGDGKDFISSHGRRDTDTSPQSVLMNIDLQVLRSLKNDSCNKNRARVNDEELKENMHEICRGTKLIFDADSHSPKKNSIILEEEKIGSPTGSVRRDSKPRLE